MLPRGGTLADNGVGPGMSPSNCHFEIEDADDEWVWSYKFDYVHGRYIVPYLADMPKLMRNIFANLTPGGYLEMLEAPMWFSRWTTRLRGRP